MDHDSDHVDPVGGSCSGGYQISSASSTNLVQIVNTDERQNLSGTQSYESTNPEPNVPSNESQFISASNNEMSSSVSITPTNPPQASILEPIEQLSVSPLQPNAGDGANGYSPDVIVGRLTGTYLNNPDIENRIVCDFLIGSFTGTFKPNDLASNEKVPPVEVVGSNHFNLDQKIQPIEGARVRCGFMRKPTFVGTFFGSISRDKIKNVCNFDGAFFGTFLGQVDVIVDTPNSQVNAANTSGGSTCTAHNNLLRWFAHSCLSRCKLSDQFIKSLVKNECESSPASEFSQFLIPVLENIPQTTGQIASSMDQSKLSTPFIFAYASKHHRHRMAYSPEYFSWEKHVLAQPPPPCIQQQGTREFDGKLYGLLKGTCALDNNANLSGSTHKGQFTGTFLVHCTGDFVDAAVLPTCSQMTTTATAATTNGKFIGYIYEATFEGQLHGAINLLGDAVSIDRLSGPGDYFGGEFLGKVKGKFVSQLVNAFMTSVDVSTGMPLTDDQRLCHQWYHFVKHDQSRRDALPNDPTSSALQMHHHNSLGHFASTEASTESSTQVSADQTANGESDLIESPQLPPQVTVEQHSNGDLLNVCSTVSTVSNESRDNSTTTSTSGQLTVVECPEDVMDHDGHHIPLYDEPNGGDGDDDDALSSASSNNLLQTLNPDELQNLSGTQSFESPSHEPNVPSNESQNISASNGMSNSESITPTHPHQASVVEPTEQLSVSPLPPNESELIELQSPQLPHSNGESLNVCSTVVTDSNEAQDDDEALSTASSSNLAKTTNTGELQNLSGIQSFESTSHETNVPSNESQYISASINEMSSSDTPTQPPHCPPSVLEPTEQLSVSPLPPIANEDNNDNELAFMTSSSMLVGQLKGTYSNNPNITNQIVCDFVIGRFTGTFKPNSFVSFPSCKYSSICEATFVGAFYGAISRDNENMCCFEGAFIGNWLGKFVKMVDITGQADDAICPAHDSLLQWLLAQINDKDEPQLNSWAKAFSQVLMSYGKPLSESNLTVPFTFVYANIMYYHRMQYSDQYTNWEQHVLDTVKHLPSSAQPSNIQQQDSRVFVGNLIGLLKGTCALDNNANLSGSTHKGQFTGTFLVECTGKFDEESTNLSSQTPTITFTGYIYEAKFEGDLTGTIEQFSDLLSIDRLSESGDYIGGDFEGKVTGKFVEYESTGGVSLTDYQKLCLQWYHFIKHDRSRRDALPNEPTSSAHQLQHSDPSGHFALTEASTEALTEASNQVSADQTANGEQGLHESELTESQSPQFPPQVAFEPDSNGDSLNVCSTVATVSNESQDKSTTITSDHSFVCERTEDVMEHDGHHSPLYVEPNGGGDDDDALSTESSSNLAQTTNTGERQNLPVTQSFESTSHDSNVPSNESQYISASSNEMSSSDTITPTQPPQASVLEPTEQLSVSPLPPNADEDNNDNELALMITRGAVVGQLKGTYSNNPNIGNQIVCDFVIGRFTGTFKPTSSASYAKVSAAVFVGAFYGAISRDNKHDMCSFDGAFIGKWLGKFVNKVDLTVQALSNGELEQAIQHDDTICPAHDSLQLWLAQIDKTDKSLLNSWAQALSQVLKSYGKPYTESDYLTVPFTFVYANIMYPNRMPYSKEYISWEEHVLDTVEHLPSSAQPSNIQQQDTRVFVGHLYGLLKGTCALNYSDQSGLHKGQFTGTFVVECTGKFDEESTSPSSQTPTITFTGYIYEAKFEGDLSMGTITPLGDLVSIDRLSESGDYIGGEFEGKVTGKFVEYESTGGVTLTDDQKLCLQWYHFIKHDRSRRDFALPNEPTSTAHQLQHGDPSGHFASTEASSEALTDASNQVSTDQTANGEQGLHESELTESQSPHLSPQVTFEPDSNGDSLNFCSTVATVSNESLDKSTTTTSDHSFVHERTEDVMEQESHHSPLIVEPNGGGGGNDDDALSTASSSNLAQTPNTSEWQNLSCPQSHEPTSHESNVPSNESQYISASHGMSCSASITPTTIQANQLESIDQIPSIPFTPNESELIESQSPPEVALNPQPNGDSLNVCSTMVFEWNDSQDKSTTTASTSGQQLAHFKCTAESCVEQFASLHEMSSHFTVAHQKRKRFRSKCTAECCKDPGDSSQGMSQPLTPAHGKRKRNDPTIECTKDGCVQHFYTFQELSRHLSSAHGIGETIRSKVECTIEGCVRQFDTYQELSLHLKRSHRKRKSTVTTTTSGQSFENELRHFACFARGCTRRLTCGDVHANPTQYVCPVSSCMAEFSSQKEARKHFNGHYEASDLKCGHCLCFHRTIDIFIAHRHWNNMNRINGHCGTGWCTDTFESQASLVAHLEAIHPDNHTQLYSCTFENCLLYSFNEDTLHQHIRDEHPVVLQQSEMEIKFTKTLDKKSVDLFCERMPEPKRKAEPFLFYNA